MNKKSLRKIKEVYDNGGNIIEFLKGGDVSARNTADMIAISYDLQSGAYIRNAQKDPEYNEQYTSAIAQVINNFGLSSYSILEAGVGEATTLANLVSKLESNPSSVYGFDLAWSRVRCAIDYAARKNLKPFLCVADLFAMPFADNSIDVVYTSHTIEPNSGREKEALEELMRVTKKYLVLLEPSYQLASPEARMRMEKHGYVKNIHATALSLGLTVKEHRLFDVQKREVNPTELIVIEKKQTSIPATPNVLVCPITKTPLALLRGSYFSQEALLAYPVIDTVPCLLEENAVIATHYGDAFK
jgi:ubiquinone/menaquinone biosynthesis C-methylase UbiE/uncharacterized protein YbaR (Trm112 family)